MLAGLSIAIAQINPVVGDLNGNLDMIRKARLSAMEHDILVLPELALTGYPPEDLILKPSFIDDCIALSKTFAKECVDGPAIVFTTPWRDGGKTYNAALFIADGKIRSIIFKKHLPNYGVFDEMRVFAPAVQNDPVEYKGRKIGILICEDLWFSDVALELKNKGADILLSPNASPFQTGKAATRLHHVKSRVKETGIPLVYVNQICGQDDLVFDGGSFAVDGDGRIVFHAPYFEEYVGPITLKLKNFHTNENGDIYNALKLGLRDYVRKNKFPGVIIGMSGGIDSALSAAIAADALGAENVRCVMLPSPFTSTESFEDAKACADALGVSYEIISIEKAMEEFEQTVPNLTGFAHENMQSRARGLILMSLSNSTGAMVLTTGNKSEMAVGYATLYGDMCGGFNVLKDVYKTRVYQLAQWRNEQSNVIPERILTKAPTAELRDGQKDQDSLPPYDLLDGILEGLIEQDKGVSDLIAAGFAPETVAKIARLLDLAEYKRRQSAPGVKITPRSFDRDRRYPITNRYKS